MFQIFLESEYITKPFEKYSELDSLGRCGVAYVNICKEIMPAEGEKKRRYKLNKTKWLETEKI